MDSPDFTNPGNLREQFSKAIEGYASAYDSYVNRYAASLPDGVERMDSLPRVLLVPGLGALCAGNDVSAAAYRQGYCGAHLDCESSNCRDGNLLRHE